MSHGVVSSMSAFDCIVKCERKGCNVLCSADMVQSLPHAKLVQRESIHDASVAVILFDTASLLALLLFMACRLESISAQDIECGLDAGSMSHW